MVFQRNEKFDSEEMMKPNQFDESDETDGDGLTLPKKSKYSLMAQQYMYNL
jgi:hypothetical protein